MLHIILIVSIVAVIETLMLALDELLDHYL